MRPSSMWLAACLLSLVPAGAHAEPIPVTTCGQTTNEGFLLGDLDCSAGTGFAVTITHRGSLDLAGYQIIGTAGQGPAYGGGVRCVGECTVKNGSIVGPPGAPPDTIYSVGIYADYLQSRSRMTLEDLTVSGWTAYGVIASSAIVTNCDLIANHRGIFVDRTMTMDSCTLSANTAEAAEFAVGRITDSSFDGNGTGLSSRKALKMVFSSASNNHDRGVVGAKKVRAEDSFLDGNCLGGAAGCADVQARKRPRLIDTTCATSVNDLTGLDWDVCSED